jgi:hypothetical protein
MKGQTISYDDFAKRNPCVLDTSADFITRNPILPRMGVLALSVFIALCVHHYSMRMGGGWVLVLVLWFFPSGVVVLYSYVRLAWSNPNYGLSSSSSSAPPSSSFSSSSSSSSSSASAPSEQCVLAIRRRGYVCESDLRREWCSTCQHSRPFRAHHCKKCGVCVLRMDHHCVWVTSCVGHGNSHDFFIYTAYTAMTGLYALVITFYFHLAFSHPAIAGDGVLAPHVRRQAIYAARPSLVMFMVVMIVAMSGVYGAGTMFIRHLVICTTNQTGIEQLQRFGKQKAKAHRLGEQEDAKHKNKDLEVGHAAAHAGVFAWESNGNALPSSSPSYSSGNIVAVSKQLAALGVVVHSPGNPFHRGHFLSNLCDALNVPLDPSIAGLCRQNRLFPTTWSMFGRQVTLFFRIVLIKMRL